VTHDSDNSFESRGSVFRWMSLFSLGQISEKIFMLAKLVLVAYLFGASRDRDVYLLAMTIPAVFFNLVGDAVYMYCLSVFTSHKQDLTHAWDMANILLTLALVLTGIFTAGYILAAPVLFHALAGEQLDPRMLGLGVRLALVLSPLYFFYMVHAMFRGFSEAFRMFGVSSFVFSISNGAAFAALWILRGHGIMGLAWATLISEALTMLVFVPQLAGKGFRYRPDFRFAHPDLRGTYAHAAQLTAGTGAFKFATLINRVFALYLPPGMISVFDYALNLTQNFSTLLRSFVNAVFPSLTQASHERDPASMRRFLDMALRAMAIAGIPMCALVWSLRAPLVRLFERGAFSPQVSLDVAATVAFLAPCILLFPFMYLLIRLYAVLQRMKTLTMLGVACMALIGVFNALFLHRGVTGLALGNTLALSVTMVLGWLLLPRDLRGLDARVTGPAVVKSLAAAAACVAGAHAAGLLLGPGHMQAGLGRLILILGLKGAAGTLCALTVFLLLRTREVIDAIGFLRRAAGK